MQKAKIEGIFKATVLFDNGVEKIFTTPYNAMTMENAEKLRDDFVNLVKDYFKRSDSEKAAHLQIGDAVIDLSKVSAVSFKV